MSNCTHENFTCTGQVEGCQVKKRRRYRVTFEVRCELCGQPFTFLDASFDGPPVMDGSRKLRWEIQPMAPPTRR